MYVGKAISKLATGIDAVKPHIRNISPSRTKDVCFTFTHQGRLLHLHSPGTFVSPSRTRDVGFAFLHQGHWLRLHAQGTLTSPPRTGNVSFKYPQLPVAASTFQWSQAAIDNHRKACRLLQTGNCPGRTLLFPFSNSRRSRPDEKVLQTSEDRTHRANMVAARHHIKYPGKIAWVEQFFKPFSESRPFSRLSCSALLF